MSLSAILTEAYYFFRNLIGQLAAMTFPLLLVQVMIQLWLGNEMIQADVENPQFGGIHGAAMMAPDYVQWHGMYEVAERFYIELIPQFNEAVDHGEKANPEGAKRARALLKEILDRAEHLWFTGNEPESVKAARKAAQAEFQKRYSN